MSDKKIRCFRCRGRKELYKIGTAYSADDTGGVKVKCPMCLGEGKILPFLNISDEQIIKNIKEIEAAEKSGLIAKTAEEAELIIKNAIRKKKK